MATNEILEFAESATNILTQSEYEANPQVDNGLGFGGVSNSALMNKILKQSSLLAASLAQLATDNQDDNVVDTLTVEELEAILINGITNAVISTAFGSTQAASGFSKLGNGTILAWGTALLTAGETNCAFPEAFPNNCFSVVANDNTSNAYSIGAYTFTDMGFKAIAKDSIGTPQITTITWHAIGN